MYASGYLPRTSGRTMVARYRNVQWDHRTTQAEPTRLATQIAAAKAEGALGRCSELTERLRGMALRPAADEMESGEREVGRAIYFGAGAEEKW
jgi:hypothetical protein